MSEQQAGVFGALVGQVGELDISVQELADDRDVMLARVVAVEARLVRLEAQLRELRLQVKEDGDEVTRLGRLQECSDEALVSHMNQPGHNPDPPEQQAEEARLRREEDARRAAGAAGR